MNDNTPQTKAMDIKVCDICQFETSEDRLKHVGESHSRGCSKFAETKNPSQTHDPLNEKCHMGELDGFQGATTPCTCQEDKEQADRDIAQQISAMRKPEVNYVKDGLEGMS